MKSESAVHDGVPASRGRTDEPSPNADLLAAAAGAPERPTHNHVIDTGFRIRAIVRKDDERAQRLRDAGSVVDLAAMLRLRDVSVTLHGVKEPGDGESTAACVVDALQKLAQSVRQQELELVVSLSRERFVPRSSRGSRHDHWFI